MKYYWKSLYNSKDFVSDKNMPMDTDHMVIFGNIECLVYIVTCVQIKK